MVNECLLALSLILCFAYQLRWRLFGATRINCRLNRVRFPAPVPVWSSPRTKATILASVTFRPASAVTIRYVLGIDDAPTPACATEMLVALSRHSTEATAATPINSPPEFDTSSCAAVTGASTQRSQAEGASNTAAGQQPHARRPFKCVHTTKWPEPLSLVAGTGSKPSRRVSRNLGNCAAFRSQIRSQRRNHGGGH
jgi:hypothetical protein